MGPILLSLTGDPSSSFYFEIGEESIETERQSGFQKIISEILFVPIWRIDFYNICLVFRKGLFEQVDNFISDLYVVSPSPRWQS
jgi:hypothetical protein